MSVINAYEHKDENDWKNYIYNPNYINVVQWDFSVTPRIGVPALFRGLQITPQRGAEFPIDILSPGGERGIHIRSGGQNSPQAVQMVWTGTGSKGRIRSLHPGDLSLSTVQGISATIYDAQNLRGSVTFSRSNITSVHFDTPEKDNLYFVTLAGNAKETFWVTDKTISGFTVHSSKNNSIATADWHLMR